MTKENKNQSTPSLPQQDLHTVRWYVMLLPYGHKGPAKGLHEEVLRHRQSGDNEFDYFAPAYQSVKYVRGKYVKSEHSLLFNYVFIRASVAEIFKLKRTSLSLYNFLPRQSDSQRIYYPYLNDSDMNNLRWVAKAYSDTLPICSIEPRQLVCGDKVRIISGKFEGAEAQVVRHTGGGKSLMVFIDNWTCIPLVHVNPDEYEVISLAEGNKHHYTQIDNDRLWSGLHEAVGRLCRGEQPDENDLQLADSTIRLCKHLVMSTDIMRIKTLCLLMQAYHIKGLVDERDGIIGQAVTLIPVLKAELAKTLLLTILYGCTDNYLFRTQAQQLIAPWRNEAKPKKNKQRLIDVFDNFEKWWGHTQ